MDRTLRHAVDRIRRRAENVVAGLLGIMFVAFVIQIVFRYVFNLPTGWTSELSVVAWLYMVLLGSAFWLKGSEEIRFDLVAGALGPRGRRVLAILAAVSMIVLFAMALPATVRYISFMKVESSSYLKIRLDVLYSVYAIFAAVVVIRACWVLVGVLRGEAPEAIDATKTSSGL